MVKTILKRMSGLIALCLSFNVFAAEKVTIMVSGIDKLIYLPVKLAEELGYLRETGLDVELMSEPAGSTAEIEMLSGVVDGVVGFYDHTLSLQARGKRVVSVVQFSHAPGEAIVVSRTQAGSIRAPADFKGRTLGVTGLGASTFHLTRYIAAQAGLNPSEYAMTPVGAGASFISAMDEGRIDAGMTTEPTLSTLLASGAARLLVDLRTIETTTEALGGPYPSACLYMPAAWIERNEEKVRKIAGAFVKALRYIETHSAEEIAGKMPAGFYGGDRRLYVKAVEEGKSMFTAAGVMPERGPATVLKVLSASDSSLRGKSINLANTFTTRFVAPGEP
ncbi:MAG: ABC transporter substrate-binding protein [Candidatus Accumulibacter sp.]|jgi:NitT/TauT family transport system substrate-binding protein|nr:ABC transporter substrate-binding protein [Accumulibacter sp.]